MVEPELKRAKKDSRLTHLDGDLLDFDADMIVQQTNCITCRAAGLANFIRNKFAYADAYGKRRQHTSSVCVKEDQDVPGTVRVLSPADDEEGPHVACLFAQYRPGKCDLEDPKYRIPECSSYDDTPELRIEWFQSSLKTLIKWLDENPECQRIAFPHEIGCGLAGGIWDDYLPLIKKFAKSIPTRQVFVVRRT